MAEKFPEPGSWTTVKSQDLRIGDQIWAEGDWQFITSSSEINSRWVQRVFIGAYHLDFPINGEVMIKVRER